MSRAPQSFTQGDVTRALKAARAAGMNVQRVEIEKNGRIVVVAGQNVVSDANTQAATNDWADAK